MFMSCIGQAGLLSVVKQIRRALLRALNWSDHTHEHTHEMGIEVRCAIDE